MFGRPETLPYEPFEYITRQAQGDFTLQDQRNDNLFMDGGMVTTQANRMPVVTFQRTAETRRAAPTPSSRTSRENASRNNRLFGAPANIRSPNYPRQGP